MMQVRIDTLFARAEKAFREGHLASARTDLIETLRLTGDHPAVLHLLAVVEQQDGRLAQADRVFQRALRVSPKDPQINNNYAILLEATEDVEGALRCYDRAIRHKSDFVDARINRALLNERIGRLTFAKADAVRAVAIAPANVAARTVLGSILRTIGELDDAAHAFDAALALQPSRQRALHGRARVALERGEPQAAALYRDVLRSDGHDRDALLGLALALESDGSNLGQAILIDTVDDQPDWIEGHRELVRMRCEAGDRQTAVEGFVRALAVRPFDGELHIAYWQTLALLDRHAEVLKGISDARTRLQPSNLMSIIEATCMDEVGDRATASRLFENLAPADVAGAIPHVRHLLRTGAYDHAATVLERHLRAHPGDMAAWAHLDVAWRLVDDDRHAWLSGRQGLVSAAPIDIDTDALADLATTLRELHRTRSHPIGQSLRGGTQTRGALFARMEPTLRHVRDVLTVAVNAHARDLPPFDATHPLLRHRDENMVITGSWSVRLQGGGFHVSHVHPHGLLSSALYISVPDIIDDASKSGWLELGAPPPELNLALAPFMMVAPEPGVLALFPSYFFHGTRPFGSGERLTIAFDVAVG